MTAVVFDTLKFVEKLRTSGLPEELASKRDIKALALKMEARIDKLDARIGGELILVKWMLGVVIATEAMPWFVKLFA